MVVSSDIFCGEGGRDVSLRSRTYFQGYKNQCTVVKQVVNKGFYKMRGAFLLQENFYLVTTSSLLNTIYFSSEEEIETVTCPKLLSFQYRI